MDIPTIDNDILKDILEIKKKHPIWKWIFISSLSFFGLIIIFCSYLFIRHYIYIEKIYPGVYLGDYSLGGMDNQLIQDFIIRMNGRLEKEGVVYIFNSDAGEKNITIDTSVIEGDSVIRIIDLNSDNFSKMAMSIGREDKGLLKYWKPIMLLLKPEKISLPIKIEYDKFLETLEEKLLKYTEKPNDAGIKITSINPLKYKIIEEQTGLIFNFDSIIQDTVNRLSILNLDYQNISQIVVLPKVKSKYLNNLEEQISKILKYGDIDLTYVDPDTKKTKNSRIIKQDIVNWLSPNTDKDNNVTFSLNTEKVIKYIESFQYILDRPAEEARFKISNGRVDEFKTGTAGQLLNVEKTVSLIDLLMQTRNIDGVGVTSSISLIQDVDEPKIRIADINNLGITAVFGIGTSTFYDSHNNRIKNIAHAVELLNGTIIAPGEEFSTTEESGPYTSKNGYFSEAVIKGNKIKNEIGGGMCQIGTTLFRMAMNSGMPITERRNHSLVVGYYADPVNGNPGTDATIYEPILDFKFLNDTNSYLLLETNIDYKKQLLTFTLWGKPDGRSGSYTHPIVSRWIPVGSPVNVYTTDLTPGKKKCQSAFKGAQASFSYVRFTSTTEKIERVFDSYYRPLHRICSIGANIDLCPDLKDCDMIPGALGGIIPSSTVPIVGIESIQTASTSSN